MSERTKIPVTGHNERKKHIKVRWDRVRNLGATAMVSGALAGGLVEATKPPIDMPKGNGDPYKEFVIGSDKYNKISGETKNRIDTLDEVARAAYPEENPSEVVHELKKVNSTTLHIGDRVILPKDAAIGDLVDPPSTE